MSKFNSFDSKFNTYFVAVGAVFRIHSHALSVFDTAWTA